MPGVKNRTLWRLRARLRIVTSKMRLYRWRWFIMFIMKYAKVVLKVLVSLLISILAELGVEYWKKSG